MLTLPTQTGTEKSNIVLEQIITALNGCSRESELELNYVKTKQLANMPVRRMLNPLLARFLDRTIVSVDKYDVCDIAKSTLFGTSPRVAVARVHNYRDLVNETDNCFLDKYDIRLLRPVVLGKGHRLDDFEMYFDVSSRKPDLGSDNFCFINPTGGFELNGKSYGLELTVPKDVKSVTEYAQFVAQGIKATIRNAK